SWWPPGCSMVKGVEISYGSRSPRPTNGSLPPPGASSASRHFGAARRRPDPTTHNGEPMDHATTSAHLGLGEMPLDLPTVPAVEGNSGIALGPLRKETGDGTYAPGFMNTANAKSSITYLDGDEGILRHRGYPIEQL